MSLTKYPAKVEQQMKEFYGSLDERSRRRYAGLEAGRLGHGGVTYIAEILGCDAKTIRQGRADLENPPDVPPGHIRKKGRSKES